MWSRAIPIASPTSPTCGPSRATFPRATPTGNWSQPKAGNERMASYRCRILLGVVLTLTAGMAGASAAGKVLRLPGAQIETLGYSALDGWTADDHAAAFGAFLKSCKPIRAGTPAMRAARPMFGALYEVCGHAVELAAKPVTAREARAFFEKHFTPV